MKLRYKQIGAVLGIVLVCLCSNNIVSAGESKVQIVSGNGGNELVDGTGTSGTIVAPTGITMGKDGNLYVTDTTHHVIRQITKKLTTTFAGHVTSIDEYGEMTGGYIDGTCKEAEFHTPYAIVPYKKGFLVSDRDNHVIRYLADGKITTFAGNKGKKMEAPTGLACDEKGNVYVADTFAHTILKITKAGKVSNYAGSSDGYKDGTLKKAQFHEPTGLCYYKGALYVVDSGNQRIRKIQNNKVTTIAGGYQQEKDEENGGYEGGLRNGNVKYAQFCNPTGIVIAEDGTIYVADTGNSQIRSIKNGVVKTVLAPDKGRTYPVSPSGLCLNKNKLYIADSFSNVVYYMKIK